MGADQEQPYGSWDTFVWFAFVVSSLAFVWFSCVVFARLVLWSLVCFCILSYFCGLLCGLYMVAFVVSCVIGEVAFG